MQQRSHITRPAGVYSILLALACQLAAMAAPLHGLAHAGEHHGGHDCGEVTTVELNAGSDRGPDAEEPSCTQCRAGLRGAPALLATGEGGRTTALYTPLPEGPAPRPNAPAIGLKPLRGPPLPTPSGVHR